MRIQMRLSIFLCALFTLSPLWSADQKKVNSNPPKNRQFSAAHQFLFFAVLEGCYREGLNAEDIEVIIPTNKEDPDLPKFYTNFVYACPICKPCYEAFRLYGRRTHFAYQKVHRYDTFGTGIAAPLRTELHSEDASIRRGAIRKLIKKWTDERMELLRLKPEEIAELNKQLTEMRKQGEKFLSKWQNADETTPLKQYEGWEECALCSGAASNSEPNE